MSFWDVYPQVGAEFDYDSWSDVEYIDEGDDNQRETLDSIGQSKTINFPIRASYTRWEQREAFRELVQNWRDAIIKSFDVAEDNFKVTRTEKRQTSGAALEIVYTAVDSSSRARPNKCLGYIRYRGSNKEGKVEIVNRRTKLQPWHLDLGGTSKAKDSSQAGAHGEGLKVALLILMRRPQNFAIRCVSGGFDWTFDFTAQGKLSAHLERMTVASVHAKEEASKQESRDSRCSHFPPVARMTAVPLDTFRIWAESALFLQEVGDNEIVATRRGSLLTSPRLSGCIFLKGLLLKDSKRVSASVTGKRLRFGYDFKAGTTNRERQSMTTATEEAEAMWRIWNSILAVKPDLVEALSEMLNAQSVSLEYADVAQASSYLEKATARKLKHFLCSDRFRENWYFQPDEQIKNQRFKLVVEGLGRTPVKLSRDYWEILTYYGFLHTAEEEEQRRFQRAPVSRRELNSTFSKSIFRLLRASFRARPQTRNYKIEFVEAGQLSLHIYVYQRQSTIKVHDQWLKQAFAEKELGFEAEELVEADLLFYAVGNLFQDALKQLPDSSFQGWSREGRSPSWFRRQEVRRTDQRLLNYTRLRQFTHSQSPSGRSGLSVNLTIKWKGPMASSISVKLFRSADITADEQDLIASDLEVPHGPRPIQTETFSGGSEVTMRDLLPVQQCVFVMHTSKDPGSFLVVSESFTTDVPTSIPVPMPPQRPRPSVVLFEKGDELPSLDPALLISSRFFDATGRDSSGTKGILVIPNHGPNRVQRLLRSIGLISSDYQGGSS
ncbi:hypothetical protein QBC40DRAFT_254598 [Triangularia verruculosa]|uniref:Uncharacterized protein n=1 Tax=Triangularia verruculosa TaxID=2587418 RepID=A0AAN7AUQ7_9PEZI|nr:hypothetical protein QBC40DRAFT_254598 [Triangularia verruculosa]